MTKQIAIFLFFILLVTLVQGQENVKGSGYVLTQQREVPFFNSIEVADYISVYVVEGSFQPITVEADDNLFPFIKTVVRNGTLKVYISDTVNITKFTDMNVLISLPSLVSIEARQAAKIDISPDIWHLKTIQIKAGAGCRIKLATQAEQINLTAQSSAIIELRGGCEKFLATLKTGAHLYARHFLIHDAQMALSTNAKAEVRVSRKISYQLSGNAELILKGTPHILPSEITSGGKIISSKEEL